jgi:hypothetical protein
LLLWYNCLRAVSLNEDYLPGGSFVKLFVVAFSLFLVSTAFALQTNLPQQTSTAVSIRGKVLQEPGEQPIRKANVHLRGGNGPAGEYSAISDAEGQFAIDNVEPGVYVAFVERNGFVQSRSGTRRITISGQATGGKTDLILHMQTAAVITGRIVDSDGDPMPRVTVSATSTKSAAARQDSHDTGNGETNDLGEFRISDLRSGRYKVTATDPQVPRFSDARGNNAKDRSIYLTTYFPGVLDEDQAVAVEAHAGAESRISLTMLTGRAFRVSGTVTGIPSGSSMRELILLPIGGRVATVTSPQEVAQGGKFEFESVLPGTYGARLLILNFEGGRPAIQMPKVRQPIEVTDANVEGLHLQLEPFGQVRGKFRMDSADRKLDWSQLTVYPMPVEETGTDLVWGREADPQTISVDSDGTFEIKNLAGGTYQLVVGAKSNSLRDYYTKAVNLDGRDVADSSFQVVPETFLDVVVSANGATVSGTVVDANGQPVANATVVDVPGVEHRSGLNLYQSDRTDASGQFSLRGLKPGKYTVLSFEELQQDVRRPEFLKTYETRGEVVQLEEGARKSVVLKLISSAGEAQ